MNILSVGWEIEDFVRKSRPKWKSRNTEKKLNYFSLGAFFQWNNRIESTRSQSYLYKRFLGNEITIFYIKKSLLKPKWPPFSIQKSYIWALNQQKSNKLKQISYYFHINLIKSLLAFGQLWKDQFNSLMSVIRWFLS